MHDEIWYREELIAMRAMVEQTIGRQDPSDEKMMVALGGLHLKLAAAIERAPSITTPKGVA